MVSTEHILTPDSEAYPPLLREISHPPQTLYVRGNIALLHASPLLAVVGSRKASNYGKQCIDQLLAPVARAGVSLVSGLAYGIDTLVHKACVDVGQPTIAVVGSGLSERVLYPRVNVTLAHAILAGGGALVSEYPSSTPAMPYHFPARNRIIAGLCRATLIVQASEQSGSLITARLALEANRDVCAVPGAITDPLAHGPNQLIKAGAIPITDSSDLLAVLDIAPPPPSANTPPTLLPDQESIYALLSEEPQHIDALCAASERASGEVASVLLELELAEVARHVGHGKYVRN